MEKLFLTVFNAKPAAQNSDTDDYHFKIPREMIRSGVIDPAKLYEITLKEFKGE